jgi:hypothetical protein
MLRAFQGEVMSFPNAGTRIFVQDSGRIIANERREIYENSFREIVPGLNDLAP